MGRLGGEEGRLGGGGLVTEAELAAAVPSVATYGAVGDGVTDDTAALNAALAVGGVLGLPAGVYRVTDTLVGASNTTLLGYGRAKIVLDTASNVDVLLFEQVSNVQVIGLEIDGQKATKSSATNTGRGIHFSQVEHGLIADCFVHDTYEHGIRLGGGSTVDTGDTTDIVVRNNLVEDCGNAANGRGWGIWAFWRVKDTLVQGNTVAGCYDGGIMFDDASSDATPGKDCERIVIDGNIVTDTDAAAPFGRGICIEGGRDFAITGNVVTGHNNGIVVNDGQGATDTGLGSISGNKVRARKAGLQIVDCRDLTISGNNIEVDDASSLAHGGIKLEKGSSGNALERIVVVGNTVRSNGAGISNRMVTQATADQTGLVVADNEVVHTGAAATATHVGIQLYAFDLAVVRGNKVTAFYDGIYTDGDCATPVVQGNLVEDSVRYGYRSASPSTTVQDNTFRGNATSSLLFDSTARVAGTVVKGNVSSDTAFLSGTTTGPTYVAPLNTAWRTGTAAPASGTFAVGDVVWNTAPAAGGTMGWVCTTAGTPGTWKTFGAIAP